MTDLAFLKQAIAIGNEVERPYNFGAVIAKDGQIISVEHGHVHETNDPSRHAEVSAISSACKKLGTNHIDGAVLYASHEPCAMCLSCAAWAHIDRIVYATAADEQAADMYEFKDPDIHELSKQLLRPILIEHLAIGAN
jgi:tRNA(Arg) A34 adenosine deaminase TadA